LDPTTLAEYADAWKAGADFPPVVVFDVDGTLYVTQGFHRYESARMAGIVRLAVEVHKGTWKEARLNAAGSNGTHGLKRSNEDKQRSVGMVLEDNPTWSNAKVAEAANVSDRMVSDYRKAHPGKNDSETFGVAGGAEDENDSETFGVDPAPEVREGKDGRKYKVPAKAPKPAAPKPARREPTTSEVNARGAFPFGHEAPEAEPAEVVEDVPAKLDTDTRQYVREAHRVKPGDKDYSRYLVGIYFPAIVKTPKGGTVVIDGAGKPVPARMADGFATPPHREIFEELATIAEAALDLHTKLDKLKAKNDPMLVNPYLDMVAYGQKFEAITRAIHDVRDAMRDCLPFAVCPACGAEDGGCKSCRLSGFMPEIDYKDYLQEQKRGAA